MRIRLLLAGATIALGERGRRPAGRRPGGRGRDHRGGAQVRQPRGRGVRPPARGGQVGRRLPRGAVADPPGDQRAHLGRRLVHRAVRPPLEAGVPRHQEGDGGPHRADPFQPRGGRARQGRGRAGAGRVQAGSWPTPSPKRAASSRKPGSRRTRCGGTCRSGPRPTSPNCASGRRPTSRRPRTRPSPSCARRSQRSRSAPPSWWCSAASTATRRSSSSRTTSTRSGHDDAAQPPGGAADAARSMAKPLRRGPPSGASD